MMNDNQNKKQNIDESKNNQKSTEKKVAKLIVSSSLATAIISWIATAEGLHLYVFEHFWQAAIISAAIQGTLFAFSINAIPLIKKLGWLGRGALAFLWIMILSASSIFSYVYISQTVYPDTVLRDDAQRILNDQCLSENIELKDLLIRAENNIEEDLSEYIDILVGDSTSEKKGNSISLSIEDEEAIQSIITDLEGHSVSETIKSFLVKIQNGNYSSNDIVTLRSMLENELKAAEKEEQTINSDIVANNQDYDTYQQRLKSFRSTNNPEYEALKKLAEECLEKKPILRDQLQLVQEYISLLKECNVIINDTQGGLEKTLFDKTLELREYMNEDDLQVEAMRKTAQEIYEALLENNVGANDDKLSKYQEFKSNLEMYKAVNTIEQKVATEIEELYNSGFVLGKPETTEAPNQSTTIIDESVEQNDINTVLENTLTTDIPSEGDMSSEDTDLDIIGADVQEADIENNEEDEEWKEYWKKRLNSIIDSYESFPEESLLEDGQDKNKILQKEKKITMLSDLDRVYLSDLNDFELAWKLLFGKHRYKSLLVFSVIFAFGIDLFSFGTGALLYFIKKPIKKETGDCEEASVNK